MSSSAAMSVGFVGLGRLGLPVATAMASRGLEVFGYDPCVSGFPEDTSHEEGLAEAIAESAGRMHFCSLDEVVANTDTIFVAVQTPHKARFEGITPLPEDRADFDYSYLIQAVKHVVGAAKGKPLTLSVISTVLPGTMARYIEPLLPENVKLVYSPSFIAMGTTVADFLDPEFVLLGGDDDGAVAETYRVIALNEGVQATVNLLVRDVPTFYETTIENAELIKVSYNTFIGLKIAFANTLMEVCHKTGCDVDEVTGALKLANRRLISPAYLDGGMGDGGACHPRDNIALSWLARELDLSHDLFEDAMVCREDQAWWLVKLLTEQHYERGLPMGVLGTAYKPGSRITTGSAALLVKELASRGEFDVTTYDPHVHWRGDPPEITQQPHVWLVGCKHPEFVDLKLPEGSVVIDPFRYIPDQEGVEVIRLGEGSGRAESQAHACSPVRQPQPANEAGLLAHRPTLPDQGVSQQPTPAESAPVSS